MLTRVRIRNGSAAVQVLGIDVGTSVVKAVFFDGSGAILSSTTRQLSIQHPFTGAQEQSVEAVIQAVGQTIRDCVLTSPHRPDLVAITAHGDGLWLTGARGNPVRMPP